ncbi:hypothetical protein GCM10017778_46790 [Streptomyces vinaceus]|nr:hypothetical protein GCM10017778_46790 [Streptomyces vinaceus]
MTGLRAGFGLVRQDLMGNVYVTIGSGDRGTPGGERQASCTRWPKNEPPSGDARPPWRPFTHLRPQTF